MSSDTHTYSAPYTYFDRLYQLLVHLDRSLAGPRKPGFAGSLLAPSALQRRLRIFGDIGSIVSGQQAVAWGVWVDGSSHASNPGSTLCGIRSPSFAI